MDDILYRGLQNGSNTMVYGVKIIYKSAIFIKTTNEKIFEVERDTVGEYLGFEDKSGKEIFSGDIVKSDTGYVLCCEPRGNSQSLALRCLCQSCEVIGNIHTHPELAGECDA